MATSPFPSDPSAALADERRRSPRRAYVAVAFLSSPTGGKRIEVLSADVSRHGICLKLRHPIAGGTFHRLEFSSDSGRPAREVRILSCDAQDDGSFQAHAEFC